MRVRDLFCASAALSVLLASACGGNKIDRPLSIEVRGLSSRAQSLVIGLYPKASAMSCMNVTLESVATLDPPYVSEWDRGSGADRTLQLPELQTDAVTIVAFSKDANAMPIQFACAYVEYKDLGGSLEATNGVEVLTLTRRVSTSTTM